MPNTRKWTIAVQTEAEKPARKITKIVGLNGSGFSVLTPYHKAKKGFVFKQPVDPKKEGPCPVPFDDVLGFTAGDRVKLSYHTDGFAQFSSESTGTIVSGRDPVTGAPKGVGLLSRPLNRPVWSGPSVVIQFWGPDDFDPAVYDSGTIVIGPDEIYYRNCAPWSATGWFIFIHVFYAGDGRAPPVRFANGRSTLQAGLEDLSGRLSSVIEMRAIHLVDENLILGVSVNAAITNFPTASGWMLNGPGDFTANRKGHALLAIYPRDLVPVEGRGSLDRF